MSSMELARSSKENLLTSKACLLLNTVSLFIHMHPAVSHYIYILKVKVQQVLLTVRPRVMDLVIGAQLTLPVHCT